MKDLMEIVEDSPVFTKEKYLNQFRAMKRAEKLKELGFEIPAQELAKKVDVRIKLSRIADHNYIVITPEKIRAYLKAKAERYDEEHKGVEKKEIANLDSVRLWSFATNILYFHQHPLGVAVGENYFYEKTCDFDSPDNDTIGRFEWTETRIKDYRGVPPEAVLSTMAEHKARNVFDYMTIAKVNAVPDPLLLGRIEGREERWFIAQWGDDVQIDDLI